MTLLLGYQPYPPTGLDKETTRQLQVEGLPQPTSEGKVYNEETQCMNVVNNIN